MEGSSYVIWGSCGAGPALRLQRPQRRQHRAVPLLVQLATPADAGVRGGVRGRCLPHQPHHTPP
eukprot:2414803-Pyramimonas_sp.AAC.1